MPGADLQPKFEGSKIMNKKEITSSNCGDYLLFSEFLNSLKPGELYKKFQTGEFVPNCLDMKYVLDDIAFILKSMEPSENKLNALVYKIYENLFKQNDESVYLTVWQLYLLGRLSGIHDEREQRKAMVAKKIKIVIDLHINSNGFQLISYIGNECKVCPGTITNIIDALSKAHTLQAAIELETGIRASDKDIHVTQRAIEYSTKVLINKKRAHADRAKQQKGGAAQ
jgi:hypothetical protein